MQAEGVVSGLHVWPSDQDEPQPVATMGLDFSGVIGDRHSGETMLSDSRTSHVYAKGTEIRNHRQVSLVSTEELALIAANLGIPELAAGVIADNICLSGVPGLTALPRMTRLEFPTGAVLMTGGVNNPCIISGRLVAHRYGTEPHKFPKAAFDLRGITAWVERPGDVHVGDAVRTHPPG